MKIIKKNIGISNEGVAFMGGDASETAMIKLFHPIADIEKMRE